MLKRTNQYDFFCVFAGFCVLLAATGIAGAIISGDPKVNFVNMKCNIIETFIGYPLSYLAISILIASSSYILFAIIAGATVLRDARLEMLSTIFKTVHIFLISTNFLR